MKAAMAGMRRVTSKGVCRPWATANSRTRWEEAEKVDAVTAAASSMEDELVGLPPRIRARVARRLAQRFAESGPRSEPWVMPVLRTEAKLRLGPKYIKSTSAFFDANMVAPMCFEEEVEAQALREHGLLPSSLLPHHAQRRIEAYRAATRALPQELRDEIFFLRANDKFFRPCVNVLGRRMTGSCHAVVGEQPAELEAVLASVPQVLLIASTSS